MQKKRENVQIQQISYKKNYISIGMKLEPSILELKNNYVITQFAEKKSQFVLQIKLNFKAYYDRHRKLFITFRLISYTNFFQN